MQPRALLFALLLAGCAGGPRGARTAVAVAGDLAECAPGEYTAVSDALAHGGASWIAVVLELIQCAPKVIHDLELSAKVADASGDAAPLVLSRGARRRIRVAKVLAPILAR